MFQKRMMLLALVLMLALSACGRDREEESAAQSDAATTSEESVPEESAPEESVPEESGPEESTPEESAAETESANESVAESAPADDDESGAEETAAMPQGVLTVNDPADVLDSYRAAGTLISKSTFADGSVGEETMNFTVEYTGAENAYGGNRRSSIVSTLADGTTDLIELYEVDDAMATRFEDEWVSYGRDSLEATMMSARDLAIVPDAIDPAANGINYVGVEEINGMAAHHYVMTDALAFSTMIEDPLPEGQFEEFTYDVWIAVDGAYVVRFELVADISGATTTDDQLNEVTADQHYSWAYELTDINSAISIAWPEDAPQPGVVVMSGFEEGAFPIPDGGELTSAFPGFIEIGTSLTVDEAIDFYSTALQDLGWSFEGDFGFYTATKGDQSITLSASASEDGSGTNVMVFSN